MALTTTQVSQLYVALFGRASEGKGNKNWVNHNKNMIDTAALMLDTDAAKNYFGEAGETNYGFVEVIYKNTLGFDNAAHIAAWAANLDNGMSKAELVTLLLEEALSSKYAGSAPQNQLINRIDVSDYMANNVETVAAENVASTQFQSLVHPNGKLVVTDDKSTVFSAESAIDEMSGGTVIDGKTFSLTTGTDDLKGTDNADLFKAALLTVNDGDTLDGGAGVDTLNMSINSNVSDKFKSSNIEKVNATLFGDASIDMKNMTGVTEFTTTGSTGKATLNNIGSATMALGFAGSTTNNIEANYTAGVLAGAADALTVNLNAAKGVRVDVDAGFESATINATGASDITTLTKPGIETIAVKGSGSVNFKNTLTNVKTLSATDATGAITTGTVDATTGFVNQYITAVTAGSSILLGAGDDNIGFQNTGATSTSTVMLGAGNDKLLLDAAGAGAVAVFGGAGDDHVRVVTNSLTANDVIDLGAGNDTVTLANTANVLTLLGVENLVLENSTGTNQISSSDTALAITSKVNGGATTLTDLNAGSTVKVEKLTSTSTIAAGVSVAFKSVEAASTIDIASGMNNGALALNNITAATVKLGAASGATASTVATTDVQSLTINATGAYGATTVQATDNKLKSVTITGTDAVTTTDIGAATTNALETVAVSAVKDLSVGTVGANSTKTKSVTLTSTEGTLATGHIGKSDNTEALAVTISSKGNITGTNSIISTKIADVSVTSSNGAVTIGAIGANATEIGNITMSAKNDLQVGLVANGTPANLKKVGTINLTSTDGTIKLVDATSIQAADADGLTVNLSAKVGIHGVTSNTTAAGILNTGNITATVSGATTTAQVSGAQINFNSSAGIVNLAATNTGGLKSTVTNAATAGDGKTSTISLGNAAATKVNEITFAGTVDTLNVTGGTGVDNITIDVTNVKGGTVALGTGADILAFTGTKGMAINLGSSTVTFSDTGSTTVAAGKAVQYDAASTSAKVVANGTDFTVSGVSEVVGTAQADYIVANAAGTKITGGAGADKIVLNAGVDTVVYTALTDSLVTGAGTTKAGIDTVTNFAADTDKIDVTTVPTNVKTVTQAWNTDWNTTMTAAYAAASGGAMGVNDALIMTLTGTNAGTYLVINDGTAAWSATADAVIELTGLTGTIDTADFM